MEIAPHYYKQKEVEGADGGGLVKMPRGQGKSAGDR
jgi:hypothetical protein